MYPRLKILRESLGMTQEEFGRSINIAKSTYNNYETGIRDPKSDFWIAIAQKYGVTIDYLMGFSDDMHETPDNVKNSPGAVESEPEKLTKSEQAHIKKYRSLDRYGKEAVDSVLDVEWRRMEAEKAAQDLTQAETASEIVPEPVKVIPLFTSAAAAGIASPVLGEDYDDYALKKGDPQRAIFAVRVQGDSMEPHFPDGSIVFCDKTPMQIGDIGVFILDGGSLLKQYCRDNYGNVYLFSLNRKRADADVTVRYTSGQNLTCMGRVITNKRFPLPLS